MNADELVVIAEGADELNRKLKERKDQMEIVTEWPIINVLLCR